MAVRATTGVPTQLATEVRVKICGLKQAEHVAAAAEAGAAYVGFVFEPRSPRYVTPEAAAALAIDAPIGLCKVGLFVDPSDEALGAALDRVPLDMIQLHGHETPERVRAVRARFGLPVMKALPIGSSEDVAAIDAYEAAADMVLLDAKPPKGATLTGGGGVAFDWRLIAGRRWSKPWMLAGGLAAENVAEALKGSGATQLDVSSGVERARGEKDAALIHGFLDAVATATRPRG